MIPGEILTKDEDILLNADKAPVRLTVANTGDRPVQVGSHYHFYETNTELQFDRDAARGMRLDIAGTKLLHLHTATTPTHNGCTCTQPLHLH